MVTLVFIRDLGSSLMFFGGFLAMLYVATNRLIFPAAGLALFGLGAWFFANTVGHVHDRVEAWQHPFDPELYDRIGGSYQLAQSLFAQADGGVWGQGIGESLVKVGIPPDQAVLLPAAQTDLIYAVIVNELGLVGAVGLLLVYVLVVERGFRIAVLARDSFSKLLAVGLTTVLALQVFVIVGGVTKVIPLTGVTLPFVSYGGSSIVANFVIVALLLLISDRARREARTRERPDRPRLRRHARAVRAADRLHVALDRVRSLLAPGQPAEQARADRPAADRPRPDPRRRRPDARALRAPLGRRVHPPLPAARAVRASGRLLVPEPGDRRARALLQRAAHRSLGRDCRTRCAGCRASTSRATTSTPRSTRSRSRSRWTS